MKRLACMALFLVAACSNEPKAGHPLDGIWDGSATPSAGSTIAVHLVLIPVDDSHANGAGSFTATAGPTANQVYSSINAIITHTDSVTMTLSGSGSSVAFFEGRVVGPTMFGKVSGGGFPFSNGGTSITLTRQ